MEKNNNNNKINRRDFFKLAGAGTLASATALYGCSGQKNSSDSESAASGEIPTDKMVYRTNPTTGDRVSILGYGCMRWPTRKRADGNGDEVDQETVNELVDYAIAHGVNYFDTSPVYVQGWSEKSTGIALKRHPREKFLIATKLSNFSNYTRENSIAMYRKSFEDLQVDYLDYYLLHSVGNGGIKTFRARYIDNGMIDFLMEERKAGRIRNLGFSYHGTVDVFDEILAMHDRIHWDFVQIQLNYADWKHASGNNVNAEYLYGELVKRGIPSIIMEPLLGGRLSKLNDHLVARLKQHRPQSSTASWAFRFAGTFPNVLTVLSGMTYMEHLQDNLRTFSPLDPCTEAEMALLEDTAQMMLAYPTIPCNDCKYCMPCPTNNNQSIIHKKPFNSNMPIIEITSLSQPGVEIFSTLTEAQLRNRIEPSKGIFIAESPKVISVAMDAGYEPLALLCEQKHITGDAATIIERSGNIPVYTGERELLSTLTGYTLTRGVLCAMRRPKPRCIEEVCRKARRIVVVDGVVDTTNIGAIFRSAAALGIDAVLLTPTSCDPLNRRAVRVSMGSVFLVPWTWLDGPLGKLNDLGFRTAAMALTDDSISIDDPILANEPKLAIVMGTEGDGLSHKTIAEADYVVRIPMSHGVDSLNVAAAAAVAFWQLRFPLSQP